MTLVTVSSNEPACTNLTVLNDNILEGCEAFFVAFEVVPNFSGVAAIPRDADKAVVVIVDDLMDGEYLCLHALFDYGMLYTSLALFCQR